MALPRFLLNKYAPLDLPHPLSVMSQDYLNILPRFNGEDNNTTQRHIETFSAFAGNLNVEQLDVVIRLFVQSLDGEARKWFKGLPNASTTTWEELENAFTQKWGEKRNHEYLLTDFNAIRKIPKEDTLEFIKRFNKKYNNLPVEIKPPPVVAHVVLLGSFESDIGFTLRERKSLTLDQLQIDALEVEENLSSAGKSRVKQEPTKPKIRKGEASSSGQDRESSDLMWDDLDKLIRSLSQKVGKLKIENKSLSKQNAQGNNWDYNSQYRRPTL